MTRCAAPLRALASVLLVMLLGACSSLPFLSDRRSDDDRRAAAEAADVRQYDLEIVAPEPLLTLLRNYLDLSRFQSAPQAERITAAELDRLAAAAPAQARALLETEGYFNAEIIVAETPATGTAALPLLRMTVVPGARVRVTSVAIEATGPMAPRSTSRDSAASSRLDVIRRDWKLPAGAPFRQPAWNDAKNSALAELRADGYAAATWSETRAKVDADAGSADLSLTIDAGPLYRLGAVRVEGLLRYDEDSVRRLAPFFAGATYSEKLLLDFQERLVKVGLFEGASVEIDADSSDVDAVPVIVRVKEQTLQQATFGIGYSANTGPRVSVEHVDRQLFGQRWISRSKVEYGPNLKSIGSELTSYPLDNLNRNLIAGKVERLNAADELRTSWSARVGRTQDTGRFERLYFAEISHARLDSALLTTSSEAVSVNYHWLRRDIDDVLLPTEGTTLSAQGGVGYGSGTQTLPAPGGQTSSKGPFVRAYTRLHWYRPIGGWYANARIDAGEVFVHDRISVPDTLLFRAGGDDSVRGYGYRTLGPEVNGAIVGGRVLLTGSVEVAHPISASIPTLWGAVFVDAGNAADTWGQLHPVLGYGVGLRWRSPVGPLRLDLAYGQDVHRLRLHVSVGIAF